MTFKFERLEVWQLAVDLGEEIDKLAEQFPKKEIFNLSNQIRRAADSVGLNIAEGSAGQSNAEQKRFLIFANRSALEVAACLIKARLRNYLSQEDYDKLYMKIVLLVKKLQAFIGKLN